MYYVIELCIYMYYVLCMYLPTAGYISPAIDRSPVGLPPMHQPWPGELVWALSCRFWNCGGSSPNYQLAVLKKYPVLANTLNLCTHTLTINWIYIHSRHSSTHSYARFYAYALCLCKIIYKNAWEIAQSHASVHNSMNPNFSTHTYFAATLPSIVGI